MFNPRPDTAASPIPRLTFFITRPHCLYVFSYDYRAEYSSVSSVSSATSQRLSRRCCAGTGALLNPSPAGGDVESVAEDQRSFLFARKAAACRN
jgi:hypothetical protein